MGRTPKLELTWIGKENQPRLEPRILIEEPTKSYHAPFRVSDKDLFDNRLIFGDNLLALKALEWEFAGKIKCIYIDPPFNTQQAFEHYDDGVEHSLWLTLMRDRLALLHSLLSNEGTLCVHIDDNELGYLLVVLDEIFGRQNKAFIATFKQGSATGHKAINPGCVSTSNYVVVYAKDKRYWTPRKVYISRERNKRYNQFISNRGQPYQHWNIIPLSKAFALHHDVDTREAKRRISNYESELDSFVLEHADSVVQLARPNYKGVSAAARELIDKSKKDPKQVFYLEREQHSDMYFVRGERIIFYKDTLRNIDGNVLPGEPLTTIWDDLPSHNLHNEGGVDFPKGKKPEALVKRVLELFTNQGDWILDSFAGSGTTGAVAHKMGRRWIMVELGEHCHTHLLPRMKRVVDGKDLSGITQAVGWKGSGGFRYYRLAPSLLQKDQFRNWVINRKYNAAMLTEAICKLEGFAYAPSDTVYWQHGHSTEKDFIYITTQTITREQIQKLSDEAGEGRSLLVMCGAFRVKNLDAFQNLTVKKIPNAVLSRCEWGRDDYSLEIKSLPIKPTEEEPEIKEAPSGKKLRSKTEHRDQATLFDMDDDKRSKP